MPRRLTLLCLTLLTIIACNAPAPPPTPTATLPSPHATPIPTSSLPSPATPTTRPSPTATPVQAYAAQVRAPDFPPGLQWFNTPGPLSLADLRGKIVLLDFWTTGCINCIHIIPDLHRLEEKYAAELVVIGVHSAKFEAEKAGDSIRQAILRYDLEHPVVNDRDFQLWSAYTAKAWPTLILIDPAGKVVGYHAGEGVFAAFDPAIAALVATFEAEGQIDRTPLALALESAAALQRPLAFPGKVLADAGGDRLFIADSNHNRIIEAGLDGAIRRVYGDGRAGLRDGGADTARFSAPQGLALDGEWLYVADTGNHAIRRIDLSSGAVSTAAGNGEQSPHLYPTGIFLFHADQPLNSPWDVAVHEGRVFIAMAGAHQLWRYKPSTAQVQPYAGNAREALGDGNMIAASLAQPSAIVASGERLYFADAESSAIRWADAVPSGHVGTLVGAGLFDFGDVDGEGDKVRLQHPLGLAWHEGLLYVADTYNNKIKVLDPETRAVRTLAGSGEAGWADGPARQARFDQPGGLSVAGDTLYIADTNNHLIRTLDLESGAVGTLQLTRLERLQAPAPAAPGLEVETVPVAAQTVAPGPGHLLVDVRFPPGYKANDLAPFTLSWQAENGNVLAFQGEQHLSRPDPSFPLSIPVQFSPGRSALTVDMTLYYCREDEEALCFIRPVQFQAAVEVAAGGSTVIQLPYTPPLPLLE